MTGETTAADSGWQQGTPAQHAAMYTAVADATRQGWQIEDQGPGWARMGKWQPVNHGALAVLSLLTLGIGLIVWAAVASRGPQWVRMIVSADEHGQVTVTHLDKQGRPT